MKKWLFFIMLVQPALLSFADSPLTSTFFATAYRDVNVIGDLLKQREEKGIYSFELTSEHLKMFDDHSIALDVKIALVNALGWGESFNFKKMTDHLARKYKLENAVFDSLMVLPEYPGAPVYAGASAISAQDLTLLGYIMAMHDYFNPMKAFQCVYHGAVLNPESGAANYVLALVMAQFYFDFDWCELHTTMRSVREAENFTVDILRPDAVTSIFEYIDLYASSCTTNQDEVYYDEFGEAIEQPEEIVEHPAQQNFTLAYWKEHPVCAIANEHQISSKGKKVDLQIVNSNKGDAVIYNDWIFYDEQSRGTLMNVSVRNEGDVTSVETNLQIEVKEYDGDKMRTVIYFQGKIPPITAGQTVVVPVVIPDYWIYDPDADFTIQLDELNLIEENDERNNTKEFHEMG